MNKKIFYFVAVTLIVVALFSFKNTPQDGWSRWNTFPSHTGIDYRVQKGDFNKYAQKWQWNYQFRNRYQKTVTFKYSCKSTAERNNCVPDHMKYGLRAGEESDVASMLINESNNIWVCIGDVTF